MNKHAWAASTLSLAIGLALTAGTPVVRAQGESNMPQAVKDNMMRAERDHLEKCYGINRVAKNDCAAGVHSCAGQATRARDPQSFVLLPAGACGKIQGGMLKPM
ncbi:MAG TPA: DUF2282 domain-containing protein [Steroidobacteraceae bacterium]|nr:DUF2282 domain-containing protein [Steroidobacteraceae bacterium]